jgi:hypothetical protein
MALGGLGGGKEFKPFSGEVIHYYAECDRTRYNGVERYEELTNKHTHARICVLDTSVFLLDSLLSRNRRPFAGFLSKPPQISVEFPD